MSYYEHKQRQKLLTPADVHAEIDTLKRRMAETCDPTTVRDCEDKLAVCDRILEELTQLSLFPQEVAA